MSDDMRLKHALILEDFDIKDLSQNFPNQKIGVNVSRIYVQIAKFNQNPSRTEEIQILQKAIAYTSNKYNMDAKYTIMELQDVVLCFGKSLKKLPKSTFVSTHTLGKEL